MPDLGLRNTRAPPAGRCPDDGDRLAGKHLAICGILAREPVQDVLEYPGHGLVVFGRGDEHSVGGGDGGAQEPDALRAAMRVGFHVRVEERVVVDVVYQQLDPSRRGRGRKVQQPPVIAPPAEAAGETEDAKRGVRLWHGGPFGGQGRRRRPVLASSASPMMRSNTRCRAGMRRKYARYRPASAQSSRQAKGTKRNSGPSHSSVPATPWPGNAATRARTIAQPFGLRNWNASRPAKPAGSLPAPLCPAPRTMPTPSHPR